MSKITAILPAYNEGLTIGSMVISTKMHVNQVIVVDDGSTDQTAEIAEIAGALVIKHSQNMGKGAALKTGFDAVKDTDIIVTIDGDGQHHPEDIPKLIKPIENGEADIIIGSRYLGKKKNGTPIYRRFGQTVLDTVTNINSGIKITDSQSGFRAFAPYTIPVFHFKETGFSIESEMLIDAANSGSRIMEVAIGVSYDQENMHKVNPISHGIGVLVMVLQDMEFKRPLYYFTIPGLVLICIGLVLGLIFFGYYLDHHMTTLLPTVMAAMIGLAGIFMAFTGLILHSMARLIERNIGK